MTSNQLQILGWQDKTAVTVRKGRQIQQASKQAQEQSIHSKQTSATADLLAYSDSDSHGCRSLLVIMALVLFIKFHHITKSETGPRLGTKNEISISFQSFIICTRCAQSNHIPSETSSL